MRDRAYIWRLVVAALLLAFILTTSAHRALAQESILSVISSSEEKADAYYSGASYSVAASLYENLLAKNVTSTRLKLKLARSKFHLRDFKHASRLFGEVLTAEKKLNDDDRILYAEALASLKRYAEAADQLALVKSSDDNELLIQNKIWRFKNVHFLYDDSTQYSVRRLNINSSAGEFGAVPYQSGLLFLSNRKTRGLLSKTDAGSGAGFFKLYYAALDSSSGFQDFRKSQMFLKFFQSKFHNGPVSFYDGGNKVAFTVSSETTNGSGERKLEIHFAQKTENGWTLLPEFPYNDKRSSNTDPFVSEDGTVMYFSSDRKGGFGGMDLYRAVFQNGKWETPVNLGEIINTPMDERFPFLAEDILYLSSNGHPGLGGLDIFKVKFSDDSGNVENLGFPVNTEADDFGLVLSEDSYKGYFSSSRKAESGDDVYELLIDQQTYPLAINGILKIKEYSWITSDTLKVLPGATISLIDHTRNVEVWKGAADGEGRFSLEIPYFSFYRLRVVHPDGSEAFVSFEIPRRKKEDYFHEIVIVRDAFQGQEQK